ncbi:hypothetical protein DAEQUDRAFT_610730 [Daedalea quercina L-15889]|uniref:Uncharacterized protein n=1 Tax=Daedalea quercina L-15889 TaxID=1314783 RepID=A0A165LHA9_9APHY|nr:hypothetical protein DAEQUDRAFT_610730 [Daedalea quercina L-15889]
MVLKQTRVVEGLQDKLASAAEERKLLELELEQSKRALILARRSIANEESDHLVTSNSGEEDETLSLDDDALDDTESRDENVFDPPSFLSCKPGRKSGEPGWSLCLPPGPDGQALQALRKTLPLPSVMDQIWKCGLAETIWSSSKARCLLVFPSQRYNTDA